MKPTPPPAGHGVSPLVSLRADLGSRPPTRDDDNAIMLAAMLRHAAASRGAGSGKRTLAMARRIATRMLRPEDIREGPTPDERGHRTRFTVLRKAAEVTMRSHGTVSLAANMLDSLAALIPPDTIEGGRLLSQRGTVLMYLGYTDLATQHFRRLVRLGQALQSRELVARGMVALASRNIVVGNLPNGEREIRRALDYAGREMPRIAAQACNQLGIVRAMRGDPDEGLALLWRAYRLSMRHGTRLTNTNVLGNVVNLLLKNGYPEAARAAAKHMLCTRPGHGDQVNALGRYANASAVLGDVAAVDWSVARLLQLASGSTFPLAIADALYECSLALERVGRLGAAARLRKRAHALAVRHGYHELAYSAGEPPATTPSKISKSTQAIVTEVRALEPDDERLPALVGSGAEGSMDRLHDDGAE